jgi:hypothetical protein
MNQDVHSDFVAGTPPGPARTNGLALASLALGLVSLPMLCCYGAGILPALGAIVTGFLGRRRISESGGTEGGSGAALSGIILGGGVVALFVLVMCAIVILILLGGTIDNVFSDIIRELEVQ